MQVDEFWRLIESARSDAGAVEGRFDVPALTEALTDRLAQLSKDEILDFAENYDEVSDRLDSWEMCAACFLICHYISDDTFTDFKAGVIALGRETFERVADDPDALAENRVVVDIADGRLGREALMAERFGYAASSAYRRLSDGDDEAYWEALYARDEAAGPRQRPASGWNGRFGDPGDRELIPVRVPRLTALFPLEKPEIDA